MPYLTPSTPMARALELAHAVLGRTRPNPAVGAVVVQDGVIVGEGATSPPGGPHAEVVALEQAGGRTRDATLYVTLEPCCTHGRTPPCTDAILHAGISNVVVAMGDPDTHVDGRGIHTLRTTGINVQAGDGGAPARRHYEAYVHHRRSGRPFVTVKFVASLDGKIASGSGDSRWVSGAAARAWSHRLRTTIDAILVGVETVLLDDPELTARPGSSAAGAPQPLRVVLDSRGRTPADARVLRNQDLAPTLIATTEAAPAPWRAEMEQRGIRVLVGPATGGWVALPGLLESLGRDYDILSLLVEGGGVVIGAFFDQQLVNKIQAVIAPMIIGGAAATAVAGRGAERMADVLHLQRLAVERLGDDLLLSGYPLPPVPSGSTTLRPAATADVEALLRSMDDAVRRDATRGVLESALEASARGEGGLWVALVADRVVGGVAVLDNDPAQPQRADGQHTATVALLHMDSVWGYHGLTQRLLDTAEASVAGRGYRWLTARANAAPEPGGWDAADWRTRRYRYFRLDTEDARLLIKDLEAASPDTEIRE